MDKNAARRVLVVDDEEPLAALVGDYLERAGFEVTLAHDGQVAVDLARQVDPDVVVLDLGLPTLDGLEVCRVLRTFSDCYVVMLTARNTGRRDAPPSTAADRSTRNTRCGRGASPHLR